MLQSRARHLLGHDPGENDLMRALAEMPPAKLAGIDEAFLLLDAGLGAVFNAGLARRAAMQRDARPASRSLRGSTMQRASIAVSPSRRQSGSVRGFGLAGGKRLRGVALFREAVERVRNPMRRLAAQEATMHMFGTFIEDGGAAKMDASVLSGTSVSADSQLESTGVRRVSCIGPTGDRRVSSIGPAERGRDSSIATLDWTFPESPLPPAGKARGGEFRKDPAFQVWVQDNLHLPLDRIRDLDSSPSFCEKLDHQMLCWQAMRADKLLPTSSPVLARRGGRPADSESTAALPAESCAGGGGGGGVAPQSSPAEPGPAAPPLRARHSAAPPCEAPAGGASHRAVTMLRASLRQGEPASARGRRMQCARPLQLLHMASAAESSDATSSTSRRQLSDRVPKLPCPKSFVEPHGRILATEAADTPEFKYLRRCELAGLVPCQSAWRRFGGGAGIVDVRNRSLNDADLSAVVETAVQCAADGQAFKALNLSGNSLTDAGLSHLVSVLASQPAACAELSWLSLAGNGPLKLRTRAVLDEFARALNALPALANLDLSGVVMQGRAASGLAAALGSGCCPQLRNLSLSGCGLGRTDQRDCMAVAALLQGSAGKDAAEQTCSSQLESADFSGNYFGQAGFAAVASALRHTRLQSLSFAGNSGGRGLASDAGPGVRFHPIQLLLEGLNFNTSIESLDLSSCGLGPDAAFVLGEALQTHPRMQSLMLADNPLGDEGIRCVIRLLISIRSSDVSLCNICGHRDADASAHQVKFRCVQPGGIYSLNLRYPHERATLRTLLRLGGSASARGGTFRLFKFDARQPRPSVEKDADTEGWVVPSQGVYNFTFQPPLSEAAQRQQQQQLQLQQLQLQQQQQQQGAQQAAQQQPQQLQPPGARTPAEATVEARASSKRRETVWSVAAVPETEQAAAPASLPWSSSTFVAPPAAPPGANGGGSGAPGRSSLARSGGPRKSVVVVPLPGRRPSEGRGDEGGGVSLESEWAQVAHLLRDARLQVSALRFPLVRAMFLALITREQQQRFVRACSKDMSFNAAQVSKLCKDRPEMAAEIVCALFPSIRGRSSQLLLLSGEPLPGGGPSPAKAVSSFLWFQEGNLTGRYRLNLAEPADSAVAENCLLVNAWETEVGRLQGWPDVSQRGNYEMLRNEEHNEVPFTYTRDWSLPNHGLLRFDYSTVRRPPPGASAMSEASEVTRYLRGSAYSAGAKLKALRAISVHMYLSAQQLRNLLLCFPEGEAREDAFCVLHTRVVDLSHMLGPALLHAPLVLREADRRALLSRLGHLHLLNPLHPEHVLFACRLAVYEERRVVEFLVQLTAKEAGGRVIREADDGRQTAVPASWADKGVPCEDASFRCTYETASANAQWRQQLAEKYCVGHFA